MPIEHIINLVIRFCRINVFGAAYICGNTSLHFIQMPFIALHNTYYIRQWYGVGRECINICIRVLFCNSIIPALASMLEQLLH